MITTFDEEKIERLINISKTKPLLPEEYVPWEINPTDDYRYLPEKLVSLAGHPLYDTLSEKQKLELEKHEVVQSMYSYGWSEGLACLFFNRHLLTITDTTSVEYRFLLRELIEEFRHQNMFSDAIMKLGIKPIEPTRLHKFFGNITVKYMPSDLVFMSVLAVEEIADVYGRHLRQDTTIYPVLRKVSELHQIEEGRHIYYTKMWLDKFVSKAGFIKRSFYSLVFLFNIYFMRTLYVKKETFEKIGLENPAKYQKAAYNHFKGKFAEHCLKGPMEYVHEFNGFNFLTKALWRRILGVKFDTK